jgi:acetyltransferase
MQSVAQIDHLDRPFGELSALLDPQSIAVIGSSDREGNLGGVAVRFLKKFKYPGQVWPVNAQQKEVANLPCYPSVDSLPGIPDLAILAVPAIAIESALRTCGDKGIKAAIIWSGGFAETGTEGAELQERLRIACQETGIKVCGPNCIGIINTANGMTASFSNLLYEQDDLLSGCVSLVSQSGGISVNVLSRARALGFGLRVTVSVGNEVGLGLADFIKVLAKDPGTKVIAVYTEGLSNPESFVEALTLARECNKPIVILKGGASEASSHAALAHTGRLAGSDRTFSAILEEFSVIRVSSTEEMIDVCGQLSSMSDMPLPINKHVLISTFGGGSGVITTDQCVHAGLTVSRMSSMKMDELAPNLTPLSACFNPVDMTPGVMTNPSLRQKLPKAFETMNGDGQYGSWLFMAAGFGDLAPQLVKMLCDVRLEKKKTIVVTWQSMPEGLAKILQSNNIYVFSDSARAVKTLALITQYAISMNSPRRKLDTQALDFDWNGYESFHQKRVVSEHEVSSLLQKIGLQVAKGELVNPTVSIEDAVNRIGFPLAMKGISGHVTHRAAAGLVALNIDSMSSAKTVKDKFIKRSGELNVKLEGIWIQHMFQGNHEFLITCVSDRDFGIMVGIGMGGQHTEIFDDVVFSRAPIDRQYATAMLLRMKTTQRFPEMLSEYQREIIGNFFSQFSKFVASAPWKKFTLEINPIKVSHEAVAAVDGLLIIEE